MAPFEHNDLFKDIILNMLTFWVTECWDFHISILGEHDLACNSDHNLLS